MRIGMKPSGPAEVKKWSPDIGKIRDRPKSGCRQAIRYPFGSIGAPGAWDFHSCVALFKAEG